MVFAVRLKVNHWAFNDSSIKYLSQHKSCYNLHYPDITAMISDTTAMILNKTTIIMTLTDVYSALR